MTKIFYLATAFSLIGTSMSVGQIIFQKTYGDSADEVANAAEQCTEGRYILGGYTTGSGNGCTCVSDPVAVMGREILKSEISPPQADPKSEIDPNQEADGFILSGSV